MGILDDIRNPKERTKFETIQADEKLFLELEEELPNEPMVQLRPQKESPGLDHAVELVESLYHYRPDKIGRNASPINTFEIWFDEGQIRFYFHPDTREQRNTVQKHFEDKYPGTRMEEQDAPFPEIDEGDYIAGARMTLSNHYARPLKMPEGPNAFDRDPFGGLTSEMVVESEVTQEGERVKAEDVRMAIQVAFQPISRDWSKGEGLFDTDLEDYADNLKKPELKGGLGTHLVRGMLGEEPEERDPSSKMRKTAKIVSELRGQPGFRCRVRVVCISPYEEIARQHVNGVCEVFETFYNPTTEQGFDTEPRLGDNLREMLREVAARDMSFSRWEKLSSSRDILSVPELASMVHLPNEEIETPNVDWTKMEKGAGVPASVPDLEDVDEQLEAAARADEQQATGEDTNQDRMRTFSESDLEEDSDAFSLAIDTGPADGIAGAESESPSADGRGLATDSVLGDDQGEEDVNDPFIEAEAADDPESNANPFADQDGTDPRDDAPFVEESEADDVDEPAAEGATEEDTSEDEDSSDDEDTPDETPMTQDDLPDGLFEGDEL